MCGLASTVGSNPTGTASQNPRVSESRPGVLSFPAESPGEHSSDVFARRWVTPFRVAMPFLAPFALEMVALPC